MAQVLIRQVSPLETPSLYTQVLHLRNQVLRIPIGLDIFQEDLSQEQNFLIIAATTTLHFGKSLGHNSPEQIDGNTRSEGFSSTGSATNLESAKEEKVVGCVVLVPTEGDEASLQLSQMAVSPEFQGQRIGSKLLESAEKCAKQLGKSRIHLHARVPAIPFYAKAGYSQITQTEYLLVGIPHHTMEKVLV